MKLNRLASTLTRGTWYIDPRVAEAMVPRLASFLYGKTGAYADEMVEQELVSPVCLTPSGERLNSLSEAPKGSIAIIPVKGVIMKDDWCGEVGTQTMTGWLKEAYNNENIVGVLLHIDSGGGSVDGTGEFAQAIENRNKPVVAFCDGLIASAAYWIGCSCDLVIISFETVEVGSIGTCIQFYDNRKWLEEIGYKLVYINATASKDKNQDFFKALDGDYKPIITQILDPVNNVFLDAVRRNRQGKLHEFGEGPHKEPLTGKMYVGNTAVEIGLVDEIGDMDFAIDQIYELASTKDYSSTKNSNKKAKKMSKNNFEKTSALKGKKADEISADALGEANAELAAEGVTGVQLALTSTIELAETNATALTTATEKITGLEAELKTEKDAKTAAESALATANEALTKANAEVTRLGALGGADPTNPKAEGKDKIDDTGKEDPYFSEADAAMAKIRADQQKNKR